MKAKVAGGYEREGRVIRNGLGDTDMGLTVKGQARESGFYPVCKGKPCAYC